MKIKQFKGILPLRMGLRGIRQNKMGASFGVGNQTEWGWLTVPIGRLAFPWKKNFFFAPAPHAKFKSAKVQKERYP